MSRAIIRFNCLFSLPRPATLPFSHASGPISCVLLLAYHCPGNYNRRSQPHMPLASPGALPGGRPGLDFAHERT